MLDKWQKREAEALAAAEGVPVELAIAELYPDEVSTAEDQDQDQGETGLDDAEDEALTPA